MADIEPSINIPSLLTLAVVSFFVIRWFFFSRTSVDNNGRARGAIGGGRRVDPAHVEQIAQMFPQLNRRDIMWDLQRNGGSVAATTERVLTGRGLETPPPSYHPQLPAPPNPVADASSSSSVNTKPQAQDLISRYNLASKINSGIPDTDRGTGTILHQESPWSQSRSERQRLLQKRRDDMIIAARRKMQERDRMAGRS